MRSKLFIGGSALMALLFLAGAGMAQNQVPHRGMGPQGGQAGIQENIVTLTGTVTAANLALGQGMPSITLQDNALGAVTVHLGPYRVLRKAISRSRSDRSCRSRPSLIPGQQAFMLRPNSKTKRGPSPS